MDSILSSVKKLSGIEDDCDHFDGDLLVHINSTMSILSQLGVGPSNRFYVLGKETKWSELILENTNLELIKTYVYLKVKLIFDPPLSSSATEAINQTIREFEWRIIRQVENNNRAIKGGL